MPCLAMNLWECLRSMSIPSSSPRKSSKAYLKYLAVGNLFLIMWSISLPRIFNNCVGVRSQSHKAKLDVTYLPNAIVASLTNKIATRSVTVQLISKSVMANHPHLTPERCFTEACTPTRFLVKGSISEEGD